MATARPSTARAAVAPIMTVSAGLMVARSRSSQKRQALISLMPGFSWMRRLPRGTNLKCLTELVT